MYVNMPYFDPQLDRKVDPNLKRIGNSFYLFGDHFTLSVWALILVKNAEVLRAPFSPHD